MKKCSKCGIHKPFEAFNRRTSRDGYTAYCKACKRIYNQQYAKRKSWSEMTTYYRYKLTPVDRQKMVEQQDGRCAICNNPGELVVDHDHLTGVVRALLCRPCNYRVGVFEVPLGAKIAAYLKTHQSQRADYLI